MATVAAKDLSCSMADAPSFVGLLTNASASGITAEAATVLRDFLCAQVDATNAIALHADAALAAEAGHIQDMSDDIVLLKEGINGFFVLSNTYLVFFMQAGFAMLCAGSVRSKNCMNILLKNILDACFGAPIFFLLGYGFAYGAKDGGNAFIGNDWFALDGYNNWSAFMFQWAFAAATATIVSGSVAERCSFQAYIGYSSYLTGFVYPVVVHWIWSNEGFLSPFKSDPLFDTGMYDFGGSGVVHSVGGIAGLMGAAIIGPRSGRFLSDGQPAPNFEGHSMTLVVLGTFVLWFGWYGFNPGSMLAIVADDSHHNNANLLEVVARAAVTTTLSGATAGVSGLLRARIKCGHWDLGAACNAILAGLVAITSGCAVLEPSASILCGAIAAVLFDFCCDVLLKLRIDDPLAAAPMHGGCGIFGVLFTGLMARQKFVTQVYGEGRDFGIFYGGSGKLLACQLLGVLCIIGWVVVNIGSIFMGMRMLRLLRVPVEEESMGLDVSHHGGSAYNWANQVHAAGEMKPRKETKADDF